MRGVKKTTSISGVYLITNVKTNKVYVGSSKMIRVRISAHKRLLFSKKHKNVHLQNAYDEYGERVFVFSVLDGCAVEQLAERELHWINHYNSCDREFGYNKTLETRCALRDPSCHTPKETDFKSRPRDFVNPEGKVVHVRNLAKFCKETGLHLAHMSSVFNDQDKGKIKQYNGWRAATPANIGIKFEGREFKGKRQFKYIFTSPTGENHETESILEFTKAIGEPLRGFARIGCGERKKYKGWISTKIPI